MKAITMKRPHAGSLFLLIVASVAFHGLGDDPAWGQASAYRIETVEALPQGLAESIASALQPHGVRLVRQSDVIGELWLRSVLPLKGNSTGYDGLTEGTLVGLLHFPKGGADFRGQPIHPGAYTLRSVRLPQDGNHMGAAPELNFLLLSPVAADQELNATFSFDQMAELSRQATGTNHPAPLMLLPPAMDGDFPGIQTDDDMGYVALRTKTRAQDRGAASAQDFPLALVLVGKAEL